MNKVWEQRRHNTRIERAINKGLKQIGRNPSTYMVPITDDLVLVSIPFYLKLVDEGLIQTLVVDEA